MQSAADSTGKNQEFKAELWLLLRRLKLHPNHLRSRHSAGRRESLSPCTKNGAQGRGRNRPSLFPSSSFMPLHQAEVLGRSD